MDLFPFYVRRCSAIYCPPSFLKLDGETCTPLRVHEVVYWGVKRQKDVELCPRADSNPGPPKVSETRSKLTLLADRGSRSRCSL